MTDGLFTVPGVSVCFQDGKYWLCAKDADGCDVPYQEVDPDGLPQEPTNVVPVEVGE